MKQMIYGLVLIASLSSCQKNEDMSERRKKVATDYFEAFHHGKLEQVFGYFNKNGTVQYGLEDPVPATDFFPQSKDLIATLDFQTLGVYVAEDTDNVIIHFSFSPKTDPTLITEAIDIISFDENDKVSKVKVIPNAKQ